MAAWTPQQLEEFNDRVPRMFDLAELIYHTYSERLALRTSVVSVLSEERGDGIKYKTPIQPSNGSWMGWDSHFGWACQGAGHINPHELAHGWSAMTGNMAGNYWEVFANWPQTYNGVYQTIPVIMAECSAFPASGRTTTTTGCCSSTSHTPRNTARCSSPSCGTTARRRRPRTRTRG
jgi:hypothetical protein